MTFEELQLITGLINESTSSEKKDDKSKKDDEKAAAAAAKSDLEKEDDAPAKGITVKGKVSKAKKVSPEVAKERDKPATKEELSSLFGTPKKEEPKREEPKGNIIRKIRAGKTSSTEKSQVNPEAPELKKEEEPEPKITPKVEPPVKKSEVKKTTPKVEKKVEPKVETPKVEKKVEPKVEPPKEVKPTEEKKSISKKEVKSKIKKAAKPTQLSLELPKAEKKSEPESKPTSAEKKTVTKPTSFKAHAGLVPSGMPQKRWGHFPTSKGKASDKPIPSGISKKQAGSDIKVEKTPEKSSSQKVLSQKRKELKGSAVGRLRITRNASREKGEPVSKVTMAAHYDPSQKGKAVKKTLETGYKKSPNKWAEKFKGMSDEEVRKELNRYHKLSRQGVPFGEEPKKKGFKEFISKSKAYAKKVLTKAGEKVKKKTIEDLPKLKAAYKKAKSKIRGVADTVSVAPKAVHQAIKQTQFDSKFKKGGMSPKEFAHHLSKGHVDHTVPEHQQYYSNHAEEIEKHLDELKKKSKINESQESGEKKVYSHRVRMVVSHPDYNNGEKTTEEYNFSSHEHPHAVKSFFKKEAIAKGYKIHSIKHETPSLKPDKEKEETEKEKEKWSDEYKGIPNIGRKSIGIKPEKKEKKDDEYEKRPTHGVHVHHEGGVEPVYVDAESREHAMKKALHLANTKMGLKNASVSPYGIYDVSKERPHNVVIHYREKGGGNKTHVAEVHHANSKGAGESGLHNFILSNPHVSHAKIDSVTSLPKEREIKPKDEDKRETGGRRKPKIKRGRIVI